jgi:large subunit ribosomal protein L25
MAEVRLPAQVRDPNKMTNKVLRRTGKVPGVYYTKAHEIRCLQFEGNQLNHLLKKEIGLLQLELDGETLPCIIREVQRHPVRGDVIHIDLYGVMRGQRIKARVPIHAIGIPVGLKEGGTIDMVQKELEIECIPTDLPTFLEVDVTRLRINDAIRLSDLQFEGIAIHGDPNSTVVHVVPPRLEAAPVAEAAAAEPEVLREKKEAEEKEEKEEKKEKKEKK